MLKIGIFGAGHLGKIHLKIAENSNIFELVGFHDSDFNVVNKLLKEFDYKFFENPDALINSVDVVSIITPTISHFKIAEKAIKASKHVFIEKPITQTDDEANTLVNLAIDYKVLGQVGHVERFNPAYQSIKSTLINPMFIEAHRLAEFNPRGTDVSVILDLMIHDIDIILSVVDSPIRRIDASGVAVISKTPDICNARVTFENGCVANFTASRISMKKMRKTRFFQKEAYIALDYLTKKVEVVKIKNAPKQTDDLSILLTNAEGDKKQIYFEIPKIDEINPIQEELEDFAKSINKNKRPTISLKDGAYALKVAHQIIARINQ
ncbi:MAG: Gfo/Idh/MocA family oxidoreductase [Flavobacteriaceae bacterium]|nr:Gfo/Idh/MocA family oxidoreductase [Flavobacteriaceae bacterium]